MNLAWKQYLANCMWLMVPVLFLNLVFARQLPPAYQVKVFWQQIPMWIKLGEKCTRVLVFILPLLLRLQIATMRQQVGIWLYLIGLASYALSWAMQIHHPQSSWSRSRWGFMAPAYTPLTWLLGITLVGDSVFFSAVYSPWMYLACCLAFLAFHNTHAWMVYSRNR